MPIIIFLLIFLGLIWILRLITNANNNDIYNDDQIEDIDEFENECVYIDFDSIEENEEFFKWEMEFHELCSFATTNAISLFISLDKRGNNILFLESFSGKIYNKNYNLITLDEYKAFSLLLACFLAEVNRRTPDSFTNVVVKILSDPLLQYLDNKYVYTGTETKVLNPYNLYIILFDNDILKEATENICDNYANNDYFFK